MLNVTLTEARRDTARVMRAAARGEGVRISRHGKPYVRVLPDPPERMVTAEEFRALPVSDADWDAAIVSAIAESRR